MSKRKRRRSKKSLREAPGNVPCACGSGKKYKECCGKPEKSFHVEPKNEPKVIDYYLTSPDGVNWTKKPGNIIAMISGSKPEDTDERIDEIINRAIKVAEKAENKGLVERLRNCRHKLYAVRYHLRTILIEIKQRVEEFEKEYSAGSGVYIEIENPRLVFETEAFLFQVKSSLDLLVQALGRVIPPLNSMHTFKKKTIEGFEHAGGTVIVALNENSFEELGKIFEENRGNWIQDLVPMRDTISHYSRLKGFHCFVEEPYRGGGQVTIHYPLMPSGIRVDEYCSGTYERLLTLYETVLQYLEKKILSE